MKSAREWIVELFEVISDEDDELDDLIAALEARDREIRAAALREAALALGKTGYDRASDAYKCVRAMADRAERDS